MKRLTIFLYGVVTYAILFITFLYAIGFFGNLPQVPNTIDGTPGMEFWSALGVDVLLLGIFVVQHSGMARPAFKRWLTRIVPQAAERSTYVLFSSLALILLFSFWQPLGGLIWQVDNHSGRLVLGAAFGFGWALLIYSTVLLNHFELLGLRQVSLQLLGKPYERLPLQESGAYAVVRHPLYAGWLLCFWATPSMSAAHLLFAVLTTLYVLLAIRLEERDLLAAHPEYRRYRQQVPKLLPRFAREPKPADKASEMA